MRHLVARRQCLLHLVGRISGGHEVVARGSEINEALLALLDVGLARRYRHIDKIQERIIIIERKCVYRRLIL